jgi:hypothetical protein
MLRLRGIDASRERIDRILAQKNGGRPTVQATIDDLKWAASKFPTSPPCIVDDARHPTVSQLHKALVQAPLITRMCGPAGHWTVLLGLDEGVAFVADPSIGNVAFRYDAFLKRWSTRRWLNDNRCIHDVEAAELLEKTPSGTDAGVALSVRGCGTPARARANEVVADLRKAVGALRFEPTRVY